ncbi:histidine phosphatase family protein [Micromonospora sp. LOL_023]|uniref:histidine phosphatase family protein n=1 Tax=Micromonospora sp. LOL_023 TaxID=3345418 RepID=UPI003A8A354D
MRILHVVTHPEATHHADGLVGGWFDSDLTGRGLVHAGRIADALAARLPADAAVEVFSSDLLRARRTAEVVGKQLGVGVLLDADLREKSYGEAGGRPQAWLDERFIPPPAAGERMRHDEGVPGAETKWELAVRAYAALDRILRSAVAHQVVVTHGGTATFLLAAWIGMPIDAAGQVGFRFSPGGVTVLREDDYFHNRAIVQLNDLGHLA